MNNLTPKNLNRKRSSRIIFICLCVFLGVNGLLTSCEIPEDTNHEFKGTLPEPEEQECPQLDSQLYQLMKSENPQNEAKELGFTIKDDKIQVLLILANAESVIPSGFNLEVGKRSGDQVQVFAPFDELCDLANTDEVLAIYLPDKAIPD